MDEKIIEKCMQAASDAMENIEPASDIFSLAYK
jgi:hypothetical protein